MDIAHSSTHHRAVEATGFVSSAIGLVLRNLVPTFIVVVGPVCCAGILVDSFGVFFLTDQNGNVGRLVLAGIYLCVWLYGTGAQLILFDVLLRRGSVSFREIYLGTWKKVSVAPVQFSLSVVAATPELILPLAFDRVRFLPCRYILSGGVQLPAHYDAYRSGGRLYFVSGFIWLICIELGGTALTILAVLSLVDRFVPRAVVGFWSLSLWSATFTAFHTLVVAGVVVYCRTCCPAAQAPSDRVEESANQTMESADVDPAKSRGKRLRWLRYALLPFATGSAILLTSVAAVEIYQPHLILQPKMLPTANKIDSALRVDDGPLIIVGAKWIRLQIPETWIYQIVRRSSNDQTCKLWLLSRSGEESDPLLCSSKGGWLLIEGEYALFASLPPMVRLRLSVNKENVLIPEHKVLVPGAPPKELDLGKRQEWALLAIQVAAPGRYRISAEGASDDVDPLIELATDARVFVNDNRKWNDRNSELVLDLGPGTYKLAVKTWRHASGSVRVRIEGPI